MIVLDAKRAWYWPSEVAEICHVSKQTVYNWIESGKIGTVLTIRPYKIPSQEVHRIINRDFLSV